MGELKTGISNLQKLLVEMEPKLKAAEDVVDTQSDRVIDLITKLDQGYDTLYLYLTEKFKKGGTTADAQAAKTLKSIMDPAIAQNCNGIAQWKKDVKAAITQMNAAAKTTKDALLNKLLSAETQALTLKKLAEKKKDKLFKSTKYKDKIKTYLVALETILKILKAQMESVKASGASTYTDAFVDSEFPITPDMTVAQVKARMTTDLKMLMRTYDQTQAQMDGYVHKWRDSMKALPGQLAQMKKWSDEADEMESESK